MKNIQARMKLIEEYFIKSQFVVKRPYLIFFKRIGSGEQLFRVNRGNGDEWLTQKELNIFLNTFKDTDEMTIFTPVKMENKSKLEYNRDYKND